MIRTFVAGVAVQPLEAPAHSLTISIGISEDSAELNAVIAEVLLQGLAVRLAQMDFIPDNIMIIDYYNYAPHNTVNRDKSYTLVNDRTDYSEAPVTLSLYEAAKLNYAHALNDTGKRYVRVDSKDQQSYNRIIP